VVAAINNCDFCRNAHAGSLRSKFGYDDEGIAEILGTIALWSEVTRFNIAAGLPAFGGARHVDALPLGA